MNCVPILSYNNYYSFENLYFSKSSLKEDCIILNVNPTELYYEDRSFFFKSRRIFPQHLDRYGIYLGL